MPNGCWENSEKNFRRLLFCRTLHHRKLHADACYWPINKLQ